MAPMIKLNININPDDIPPNIAKYNQEVSESLQEISNLVPNHNSKVFIKRLWGYFKLEIWKQQGYKCAFCEKSIVADDTHLEHFRPKAEARDKNNTLVTREAYWWLVYEQRNYMASCSTCNNQKGNLFPIEDEGTRVTAANMDSIVDLNNVGDLGEEIPCIINPRHKNPKPHLEYRYAPDTITPMVYIAGKDNTGERTIKVLDLNRTRKNKKKFRDNLPGKRGNILLSFKKEIRLYEQLKDDMGRYRLSQAEHPELNLQPAIDDLDLKISRKRQSITKQFLSHSAEFSGMCLFWLQNDTELANDFIEEAA